MELGELSIAWPVYRSAWVLILASVREAHLKYQPQPLYWGATTRSCTGRHRFNGGVDLRARALALCALDDPG